MHKEFLKLLEKATGRSEHVITVNFDIRGFTPFCETEDSLNVATYITRVYLKILNDYFKNASFYKPTGDGLIIIVPYDRENLRDIANSTTSTCLNLLENFGSLCNEDPMVNFPTPQKIGIGLTRGSVCCITSEDKILDYSGRKLNLASRLMDLARPSGIVLDDSFGLDLLKDETKELFAEDNVYVRGVAEENPIKIYYTRQYTLIPDSYKEPLKEPVWQTDRREYIFEKFKRMKPNLEISLTKKPLDISKITVRITHENPDLEGLQTYHNYYFPHELHKYRQLGTKYYIVLDTPSIVKSLEEDGVSDDMKIRIAVIYPSK